MGPFLSVFAAGLLMSTAVTTSGLSRDEPADLLPWSASSSASHLIFEPAAPMSGGAIHVEYQASAAPAPDRLVLRARFRTPDDAAYNTGIEHVTVGELRRDRGHLFRGSFRLPESVVFGVFAVEHPTADWTDTNAGRFWELLVHGRDGRPLFEALAQRFNDYMGRDMREVLEALWNSLPDGRPADLDAVRRETASDGLAAALDAGSLDDLRRWSERFKAHHAPDRAAERFLREATLREEGIRLASEEIERLQRLSEEDRQLGETPGEQRARHARRTGELRAGIARALAEAGERDRALEELRDAVTLAPTSEHFRALGDLHYDRRIRFDQSDLSSLPRQLLALRHEMTGSKPTSPREPLFRSLFDGQTLAGWEGNLEVFRVEDGAIVGGRLEARIPNNEFLCTTSHFEDFELRVQAKLVGPGDNAGIQFRTHRVPNHAYEVSGYQADMGTMSSLVLARMSGREPTQAELEDPTRRSPIWGHLYDESRRNRFLAGGPEEEVRAVLRKDDWNEFVIRAEGPRIRIWLNGLQTVDYVEEDEGIDRAGAICLQIHSGGPSIASYREIAIRELGSP